MKPKTLTLRVTDCRIGDDDASLGALSAEFGTLRVFADTVRINGPVTLPGMAVELFCRSVKASQGAALDVSGAPAEPSFDPGKESAALRGTAASPHGQPGADGGPGHPGGSIRIVCESIEGGLALIARGSNGGQGQRGGDGVTPPVPHGADASFLAVKGGGDPVKSKWGGGVLQGRGLKWYVAWASGQSGGNALNGGNAGASGRGGAGGDGGSIQLVVADGKIDAVTTDVSPGEAGDPGAPARPAGPSAAGNGGRNRICHIHWVLGSGDKKVEAFVGGKDKDANDYAKKYKVAARAKSGGGKGAAGTEAEPPEPSVAGMPGQVSRSASLSSEAESAFPLEYLELIERRAEQQIEKGDSGLAKRRLGWLERITRARAESDQGVARVRRESAALREQANGGLH